jgi:hypothetical protein
MHTNKVIRAASFSFLLLIATVVGADVFRPAIRGLDYYAPPGGTVGQVVTRTATGAEWDDAAAGGATYAVGPTACLDIDETQNPDEIDIVTACVPRLTAANVWGAAMNTRTPSATQVVDAVGDTILANADFVQIDPNAAYTLTSTPTIADGTNGDTFILCNIDTTHTVTLQREGALANTNIIGSVNVILAPKDCRRLHFSTALGGWSTDIPSASSSFPTTPAAAIVTNFTGHDTGATAALPQLAGPAKLDLVYVRNDFTPGTCRVRVTTAVDTTDVHIGIFTTSGTRICNGTDALSGTGAQDADANMSCTGAISAGTWVYMGAYASTAGVSGLHRNSNGSVPAALLTVGSSAIWGSTTDAFTGNVTITRVTASATVTAVACTN